MPAASGSAFRARTERWRNELQALIDRYSYPWPVELALALVDVESGGKIGEVNKRSGASGLLQVMPIVVREYNRKSGRRTSLEQQRGTTYTDALAQLDIGLWALSRFWAQAYDYLERRLRRVPLDDYVKISCVYYVAGPVSAKKRLDKLSRPTWSAFKSRYPQWSGTNYARTVWARAQRAGATYDEDRIRDWLSGEQLIARDSSDAFGGFLLSAGLLSVVWHWMQKRH